MTETSNWYILRTPLDGENKLAALLKGKGYETFCPRSLVSQQLKSRYNGSTPALFPNWLFVKCTNEQLCVIKRSEPHLRIVYRLSEPAVVSSEEVRVIREVLCRYQRVRVLKTDLASQPSFSINAGQQHSVFLPSLGLKILASGELTQVSTNAGTSLPGSLLFRQIKPAKRLSNFYVFLSRIPFYLGEMVTKVPVPPAR